jgi:hypothetical protein
MDIETLKKVSEALLPLADINENWEKSWLAVKNHLEEKE